MTMHRDDIVFQVLFEVKQEKVFERNEKRYLFQERDIQKNSKKKIGPKKKYEPIPKVILWI